MSTTPPSPPARAHTDTRALILDIGEQLLQRRGFNAFSYQDIADELGIRKASIHYHFPAKADLGAAIAARHIERVLEALRAIDALDLSVWQRLDRFFEPFIAFAKNCDLMCVGGALAAEHATLPGPMQEHMGAFFTHIHTWLTRVLRDAQDRGELTFTTDAAVKADIIIAMLEGAILIAKSRANGDFIDPMIADIKASLTANPL